MLSLFNNLMDNGFPLFKNMSSDHSAVFRIAHSFNKFIFFHPINQISSRAKS